MSLNNLSPELLGALTRGARELAERSPVLRSILDGLCYEEGETITVTGVIPFDDPFFLFLLVDCPIKLTERDTGVLHSTEASTFCSVCYQMGDGSQTGGNLYHNDEPAIPRLVREVILSEKASVNDGYDYAVTGLALAATTSWYDMVSEKDRRTGRRQGNLVKRSHKVYVWSPPEGGFESYAKRFSMYDYPKLYPELLDYLKKPSDTGVSLRGLNDEIAKWIGELNIQLSEDEYAVFGAGFNQVHFVLNQPGTFRILTQKELREVLTGESPLVRIGVRDHTVSAARSATCSVAIPGECLIEFSLKPPYQVTDIHATYPEAFHLLSALRDSGFNDMLSAALARSAATGE